MKACTKCGEEKPLEEFHRQAEARDGRRPDCGECVRQRQRSYQKGGGVQLEGYLRRTYGLSLEAYDAMRRGQDEKCLGCGEPLVGRRQGGECVDHCHETGVVRGILCNGCNLAIGYAKDRAACLRRLADYLEAATCPM